MKENKPFNKSKMTHLDRFSLYLILCLISSRFAQGNFDLSNNLLQESRYANGELAHIVAQYVDPDSSRDIPTNPLFYGFFYGYNISDSLRLISEKYLSASYDTVSEFTRFLDKAMSAANITDPFAYYQKPLDPESARYDPYYHTTAKFCGRKNCAEYYKKAGKYLGKPFDMHIVGLCFTTRTYGFRVKLTIEEQSIFEVDERRNSIQAVVETKPEENVNLNRSGNTIDFLETEPGHEYEGYFRGHGQKVESHPLYPGIHFSPQARDFHPTESRAHVTLGCAPDITPDQTGLDLLEIIDLEISGGVYHQDFTIGGGDLPLSILRQFGGDSDEMEEVFVIYPNEKMVTQATFSVYL